MLGEGVTGLAGYVMGPCEPEELLTDNTWEGEAGEPGST